jgi:ABC-2 type transport system ATP-binding protein
MTLALAAQRHEHASIAPRTTVRTAGTRGPFTVSVENIFKSFPRRRSVRQALRHPLTPIRTPVLNGISLDVADGELFGVLGLNGAGKTTLLKILATLILPEAGTATIGGFDLHEDPDGVRDILALVTADERSLHWRLSALENMRLFGALHRLTAAEGLARSLDALETVKLADVGDKMVGAHSSGMRQRLLLARALMARPRVLLLDEPTRSLDPVSAHEFRRTLRDDIVGKQRATVILATHNSEEAFHYCDRVAVLHQGAVAAVGSAGDLSTQFVPEVYRIWTPTPGHPCFELLVRRGLLSELVRRQDSVDETTVECVITRGGEPEVLRQLIEARVAVKRFERAASPLPALIARIVDAHERTPTKDTGDA